MTWKHEIEIKSFTPQQLAQSAWRNTVQELKGMSAELNSYNHLMTEYERSVIQRKIQDKQQSLFGQVTGGISQEFGQVIQKYQAKHKALLDAVNKENNRWDMVKLAGEMTAIKQLVDMTVAGVAQNMGGNIAPKLTRIYQEAMGSDNIHRQRAAAEVISGLMDTMPRNVTDRALVNGLARGAKNDLENLRFTDDMVEKLEERNKAVGEYANFRREIVDAAVTMGEVDPSNAFSSGYFAKLLKSVRINPDDSMEILPQDDPAVTGIDIEMPQMEAFGG